MVLNLGHVYQWQMQVVKHIVLMYHPLCKSHPPAPILLVYPTGGSRLMIHNAISAMQPCILALGADQANYLNQLPKNNYCSLEAIHATGEGVSRDKGEMENTLPFMVT